jgi:hypothetical protein
MQNTTSQNGTTDSNTAKQAKRKGKGKKDGAKKERIQRLDQLFVNVVPLH